MSLSSEFVTFQPEQLTVWAGNPRKTIDPAKLAELAASIKARGIDHPITVRATAAGEVEIIAGQRRYLAAKIAGLTSIPCRVRDLTDDEALELAIAENAARADVSPIEEAEAIESYLASGRTIEQAADRFGRTVAWVTGRTRLLALTPAWRERVASDRCPLRHAELLSRLSPSAQAEAAKRWDDREIPAFYEFERAVQLMLHRLAEAPFPLGDDTYPRGSCDGCPSRSDKQRDLFSAEATDDDASCLDPTCWAAKVEHRWTVAQKDAKRRKLRVLSADEAKLFDSGVSSHASEWVEIERGAKEGLTATAIARTEDGLVVELVSRRAYVEACEARRLRIKAELEAQAAERGATKRAARTDEPADEPADVATAPTIPPSAPVQDEGEDEEPASEEIAVLRGPPTAEQLARVASRQSVEQLRRIAQLCAQWAQFDGPRERVMTALKRTYEAHPDDEHASYIDAFKHADAEYCRVAIMLYALSAMNRAAVDSVIAEDNAEQVIAMVKKYAAELDAARTTEDLAAAWEAIVSEDHRDSLPALARRWTDRAKQLGLKTAAINKLRRNGQAPAPELTKEAA